MFYSPNLDDDGHDPMSNPQEGLKKASDWLRVFLTTWLHFDATTWVPKDEQMKRTLVIVTFAVMTFLPKTSGSHSNVIAPFLSVYCRSKDVMRVAMRLSGFSP